MMRFSRVRPSSYFGLTYVFSKSVNPTILLPSDAKLKMAYFATIFYLFMAQYALVLSADSSSWKDSDLGFLLQNKRTHQLQVIYEFFFFICCFLCII